MLSEDFSLLFRNCLANTKTPPLKYPLKINLTYWVYFLILAAAEHCPTPIPAGIFWHLYYFYMCYYLSRFLAVKIQSTIFSQKFSVVYGHHYFFKLANLIYDSKCQSIHRQKQYGGSVNFSVAICNKLLKMEDSLLYQWTIYYICPEVKLWRTSFLILL